MGFRLSGQVLESSTGLTPAQKLMLLGLASRADQRGENAFPGNATLAKYAECSGRNVEIGLKELLEHAWISVQRPATHRFPTTYRINVVKIEQLRSASAKFQQQRLIDAVAALDEKQR